MNTVRSFLAIKLDLQTARALAEAQILLKNRCADAGIEVAWVPPPNIHVTMLFLGSVNSPLVTALKDMLKPAISDTPIFELRSAGLGIFPDPQQPKIIWAGISEEDEALTAFHKKVSDGLTEAGFQLDTKPFQAHVTLGRIKGGNVEALEACLAENAETVWGTTSVRNLYCYRSDLSPAGAEYHQLWRLPLSNRGRANRSRQNQSPSSDRGREGNENR